MQKKYQWASLFVTNFLGVLNNNFLRNLFVFVSVSVLALKDKELMVTLAAGLYVLPYIFFSPLGGRLAKAHRKSDILFWTKMAELFIFILACFAFYLRSVELILFCVFGVGLTSTLFSPSKYGLIRDIGGEAGLSFGTGTLEMMTFFGVLLGSFVAGIIADNYTLMLFMMFLLPVAIAQVFSARMLKNIQETAPMKDVKESINPITFLVKSVKWAGSIPSANVIIAALAVFWMSGNFIQMNILMHCDSYLNMDNTQTGLMMIVSAVGIGVGSFLTGLLSGKKIELGFTPIGAIGMMVCLLILYFARPVGYSFSVLIFLTSFFSSVYMVPLSAWVQHSVDGRLQGDMLAYSNFTIFLFILISAGIYAPVVKFADTHTIWLLLFVIIAFILVILLTKVKGTWKRTLSVLSGRK
ncbi:MAG: MFS transporter [Bacteroidales bacterium]|nr:MFS transporter [Bacteroidales bacterium]